LYFGLAVSVFKNPLTFILNPPKKIYKHPKTELVQVQEEETKVIRAT
jgi:hypothetical protein